MTDSATTHPPAERSTFVSTRSALNVLREGAGILLSATALAWLMRLLVLRDPVQAAWTLQVMLALAAFLAGCWGAVHRYRTWSRPMRELLALVDQVQSGQATIEELNRIEGGPRALVPCLQELFRELRQQRAAINELDGEIRQRIANRTDALERTIGTLRHQATRDALTGLFNRRFLDQFLPTCIQRHQKDKTELCVLMIDVDNFKMLNDTLGHAQGDELLKSIGQLIRSTIRGEDVAFRCGGDEFVVLLPGFGSDAGRALADRLVSLVDALAKTLKVSKPPRLSIGLATLSSVKDPTPETLLEEADRVLYEVKSARKKSHEGKAGAGGTGGGLQGGAGGVQSSPLSRKAG